MMLDNILDNIEQFGQRNIVQFCLHQRYKMLGIDKNDSADSRLLCLVNV